MATRSPTASNTDAIRTRLGSDRRAAPLRAANRQEISVTRAKNAASGGVIIHRDRAADAHQRLRTLESLRGTPPSPPPAVGPAPRRGNTVSLCGSSRRARGRRRSSLPALLVLQAMPPIPAITSLGHRAEDSDLARYAVIRCRWDRPVQKRAGVCVSIVETANYGKQPWRAAETDPAPPPHPCVNRPQPRGLLANSSPLSEAARRHPASATQ